MKNKYILCGLAPNFKRGKAVFERDTRKIVEMDVLGNELLMASTTNEEDISEPILQFSATLPHSSSTAHMYSTLPGIGM